MIRFFRRIRQKLFIGNNLASSTSRSRKYFFYAIGEITLVMVGILLALQVNNWNTNKQETKELHNYLESIQRNLKSDLKGIKEIRLYRDSSIVYSLNYLSVAKKELITIDDFNSIMESNHKVQFDRYFKPHKSGFETLKNSGYLGKLNGTSIETELNAYYYQVDKIIEREESLIETVEDLENIAWAENITMRLFEIHEITTENEASFSRYQKEIKELLNFPSMMGANFRNRNGFLLRQYYRQAEKLAKNLVSEIDNTIKGGPNK